MKKFPKLSKKELRCIARLKKRQHDANFASFDRHIKFIAKYCFENELRSLSFKRRGNGIVFDCDCSFYNPLDFMTPARRRDVEKQLEESS